MVWNFLDLIHRQLMLEAPQDVQTMRFNTNQPHIVAGGLYDGKVVIWEFMKAEALISNAKTTTVKRNHDEPRKKVPIVKPLHVSYIDAGHRRPISDLEWLPATQEVSNRGHVTISSEGSINQFVTIAGDGQICFWDLRFEEAKYRGFFRS